MDDLPQLFRLLPDPFISSGRRQNHLDQPRVNRALLCIVLNDRDAEPDHPSLTPSQLRRSQSMDEFEDAVRSSLVHGQRGRTVEPHVVRPVNRSPQKPPGINGSCSNRYPLQGQPLAISRLGQIDSGFRVSHNADIVTRPFLD